MLKTLLTPYSKMCENNINIEPFSTYNQVSCGFLWPLGVSDNTKEKNGSSSLPVSLSCDIFGSSDYKL